MDVRSVDHRALHRLKRFMRRQDQPVRIKDQRVTRNSGLGAASTSEPAVYDEQLAVALHR